MPFVHGSNRNTIPAEMAVELRRVGALIDGERERTRWFDGRFLAARDLVREQQYFLTREADLGKAAGSGVAVGLEVAEGAGPRTVRIAAGHGVTPSGELVLLERDLTLNLADVPRAEQLSGKFGLGRIPTPPLRSRTGLFALALRPVEYTANPVGAYPTSITGERTLEDGDVIEATAVVLVPWMDDGGEDALEARRSRAARSIFVQGEERGLSASVLPLAMLALDNNTLAWIDVPMLRRELGADRADLPGLGVAGRALSLSHLLQHQGHLADMVSANGGRSFPAASAFGALPPAGPLPPGVIDPGDFTQSYFPAEVEVDFSILPEDELPALVDEALALPPLDLTVDEEALESTSVLVLALVPRNEWRSVLARLETLTRVLRPSAANRVAARKPLEILQRLRVPALRPVPADPSSPSDAEWQRLVGEGSLWYVRRRNLAYREDVTGTARRIAGQEREVASERLESLERLGLRVAFDNALERATPAARAEITNLIASPRLADSPALTAATLGEFTRAERVDLATALRTTSEVTAPSAGEGLARLDEEGIEESPEAIGRIMENPEWRTLDRAVRAAPREEVRLINERIVAGEEPITAPVPTGGGRVRPGRVLGGGSGGGFDLGGGGTPLGGGSPLGGGGRR